MARIIRENRATVVCAAVVALAIGALFALRLAMSGPKAGRLVALVHDAEGEVHVMPLDRDDTLVVTTSAGTNTVAVEDGAVRMVDADCPQRTCLQATPLRTPGRQIICLPHELWIEVATEGSDGSDMDVTQAQELNDNVDLVAR
ncbi:MAG: NusG domain II-containing protein [Atopobiaceae bacterium]|nr:NusG domain II-containing protein [Atopobiaceae bacterium]